MSRGTARLLAGGVRQIHAIASAVDYFVLVIPFNLLLVAYSAWILLRKEGPVYPRFGLFRTLAIGGFSVLFCSSVMLFAMDVSRLGRVQFIIFIMFLLFAFTTARALVSSGKLQKLSRFIGGAAVFALIYTVVYSPRLFTSRLSRADKEAVQLIDSITNHEHQRIFMLGEWLSRMAPFVTFQSFVEIRKGRYYHQDPNAASEIYRDFTILKEKTDEWKNVARERSIKRVILRTSVRAELEVFNQYENEGILRYKHRDWVVLELNL